jgi:hypothetical protein
MVAPQSVNHSVERQLHEQKHGFTAQLEIRVVGNDSGEKVP